MFILFNKIKKKIICKKISSQKEGLKLEKKKKKEKE